MANAVMEDLVFNMGRELVHRSRGSPVDEDSPTSVQVIVGIRFTWLC